MNDNGCVLIADDEETVLESTAALLEEDGFECTVARNALEAMELLDRKAFDLVILDWKMPGNTDLEVVRYVRLLDGTLPVILITGYPRLNEALERHRLEVYARLVKPYDLDQLVELVQSGVAQHRQARGGANA
jgi:two-component system response regulator AtoC